MTFEFEYAAGTFTSRCPNSHKKRGFGRQTKEVLLSLPCPSEKERLREVKKDNVGGGKVGWILFLTHPFMFWEEYWVDKLSSKPQG